MDEKLSDRPSNGSRPAAECDGPLQKIILVGGFAALVIARIALLDRKDSIGEILFLAGVVFYVIWLTFVTFWKPSRKKERGTGLNSVGKPSDQPPTA